MKTKSEKIQCAVDEQRPTVTLRVSTMNKWRESLESHLKAGDDVEVIGMDCKKDKILCKRLAKKFKFYYECDPKYGKSGLDYGRFWNKKFHSYSPPDLSSIPPNFPIPKEKKRSNR